MFGFGRFVSFFHLFYIFLGRFASFWSLFFKFIVSHFVKRCKMNSNSFWSFLGVNCVLFWSFCVIFVADVCVMSELPVSKSSNFVIVSRFIENCQCGTRVLCFGFYSSPQGVYGNITLIIWRQREKRHKIISL